LSVPAHLRVLFCLLAALSSTTSFAAERAISGQVIGADGEGVADAVVFVEAPAAPNPKARTTATMDQVDKTFVPGVLPVVAGTQVSFPNRDQIRHHVYSFSRAKRFELPLYKGEEAPPVLFDVAGVVKIGCNIHDWMSAIILVLPNAHYAVTDEHGRFKLSGLESGHYTITAWHARSREKTTDVAEQVDLGEDDHETTFKLSLAPARARPATRGARWE
jgi:plastocyanin